MKKLSTILSGTIFSLLLLFVFAYKINAANSNNVYGYAWSDNIGWISFNNCTNPVDVSTCSGSSYGVNIDNSTGNISGYAWSDNIGWISFNRAETGNPPSNDPGNGSGTIAKKSSGKIIGWARALAPVGSANAGGWDGWISFDGNSYSVSLGSPNNNIYPINGYAWGSDVVGWVDMSRVMYIGVTNSVSLTLTPSATTILSGDTVDFSWSANGFTPTSCTGTGGGATSPYPDLNWATTTAVTSASGSFSGIHVPPNVTTQFTLTCTDGTNNISQAVSITATPLTTGVSNSSFAYNGSCVPAGSVPTLSWSKDSSSTCTIKAHPSSGSDYSFPVRGTSPGTTDDTGFKGVATSYALSCTNGSGSYASTATSGSATVTVCPPAAYDYSVNTTSVCTGGTNPGINMSKIGTGLTATYQGVVALNLTPINGFSSDAPVSGSSSIGTFSLTPSLFTDSSGSYNSVNAILSLTQKEYNALLTAASGGVLESVTVTAQANTQNTSSKAVTLDFCTATAGPPICLAPSCVSKCSGSTCSYCTGASCTYCTGSVCTAVKPHYTPF